MNYVQKDSREANIISEKTIVNIDNISVTLPSDLIEGTT